MNRTGDIYMNRIAVAVKSALGLALLVPSSMVLAAPAATLRAAIGWPHAPRVARKCAPKRELGHEGMLRNDSRDPARLGAITLGGSAMTAATRFAIIPAAQS